MKKFLFSGVLAVAFLALGCSDEPRFSAQQASEFEQNLNDAVAKSDGFNAGKFTCTAGDELVCKAQNVQIDSDDGAINAAQIRLSTNWLDEKGKLGAANSSKNEAGKNISQLLASMPEIMHSGFSIEGINMSQIDAFSEFFDEFKGSQIEKMLREPFSLGMDFSMQKARQIADFWTFLRFGAEHKIDFFAKGAGLENLFALIEKSGCTIKENEQEAFIKCLKNSSEFMPSQEDFIATLPDVLALDINIAPLPEQLAFFAMFLPDETLSSAFVNLVQNGKAKLEIELDKAHKNLEDLAQKMIKSAKINDIDITKSLQELLKNY